MSESTEEEQLDSWSTSSLLSFLGGSFSIKVAGLKLNRLLFQENMPIFLGDSNCGSELGFGDAFCLPNEEDDDDSLVWSGLPPPSSCNCPLDSTELGAC